MIIAIPTYGRYKNQRTWNNLPVFLRNYVIFFVQARERHLYHDTAAQYVTLPDDIRDIASTRQYILDYCCDNSAVIMVDDDLDFATRRKDDPNRFSPATDKEITDIFFQIANYLSDVPHVGVSCREGANRNHEAYLQNTRILRIHGFNLHFLRDHNIRFEPKMFMTDFDVTLQILERGGSNMLINWAVQNQQGSNVAGGCSESRSLDRLAESARWLKDRHPDFVQLVTKQTKTSWGGNERTDVRIQWKKAYEHGRSLGTPQVLDGGAGHDPSIEGERSTETVE